MSEPFTIDTELLERRMHGAYDYAICIGSDGGYYAIRTESPFFCLAAESQDMARQVAERGIDFYVSTLKD